MQRKHPNRFRGKPRRLTTYNLYMIDEYLGSACRAAPAGAPETIAAAMHRQALDLKKQRLKYGRANRAVWLTARSLQHKTSRREAWMGKSDRKITAKKAPRKAGAKA